MTTNSFQKAITSAVLALAVLVVGDRVACADDPTQEAMEKSSALFKQGRALQMRGKWAEAEAAYQGAWDLRRTFDIAGNLGDCELHVGQPREAAEHLSYALKNVPAGVLPEQTEALKRLLKDAQAQVGTLRVHVNIAGAQVFVDGRQVEQAAGDVFVDPGRRAIEARLAGHAPATASVDVRAGAVERVDLTLAADKRSIVPAIVMGSVAGVALVTGIGLFAGGRAKGAGVIDLHESIRRAGHACVTGALNYDARCEELESAGSTSNALQRAGVGLWIGATAAALGSVLYLVVPRGASPSKSGLTITPTAAPSTGGLVLSGTF